jgi:O-acetyl-ADP-ribose deacetylase (regulator of RNase III)
MSNINQREIIMQAEYKVNDCIIELIEGDITGLAVDAIVNAANTQLILGGGVAGAIREKGGSSIQEECRRIGGTNVGGAVITGAGNLKANHVIHAVGPRMGEGDEDLKLENATQKTLQLVVDNGLNSVALPAISTGIFGFPIQRCAGIMIRTTQIFLKKNKAPARVIFCLWGEKNYNIFKKTIHKFADIGEYWE